MKKDLEQALKTGDQTNVEQVFAQAQNEGVNLSEDVDDEELKTMISQAEQLSSVQKEAQAAGIDSASSNTSNAATDDNKKADTEKESENEADPPPKMDMVKSSIRAMLANMDLET